MGFFGQAYFKAKYFAQKLLHGITDVARVGGDDAPWVKEKKRKRKDEYAENVVARKQALIVAYKGLLEPETPEVVAIEAKTVVESTELGDLDLAKVQKLLAMWQAELDRREQDDEEAILMLIG